MYSLIYTPFKNLVFFYFFDEPLFRYTGAYIVYFV